MSSILQNLSPAEVMRKLRQFKRTLLASDDKRIAKKVAILGGSTTNAVKDALEVYLLDGGIEPSFYESSYNRFCEDAMFSNPELDSFRPEIIYLHTSNVNIQNFPLLNSTSESVEELVSIEVERWENIWKRLLERYPATIVQNNFEYLPYRDFGNLDTVDVRGRNSFILKLNDALARRVLQQPGVVLQDIHYLSASVGLEQWHDPQHWYAYKYCLSHLAIPHLAQNLTSLIRSICGKSRKCLVLDLDNTLWGGVIGDDGLSGLKLGHETPEGEAHIDLQNYIQRLSDRGVVLAVASKNEHKIAKTGFDHPDSVLKFEDFGAFKANWGPKNLSIRDIAYEINLGLDSFVFLDDNPAERALVQSELPMVTTPEIGSNVSSYLLSLDRGRYFEPLRLSEEDFKRKQFYADNLKRNDHRADFADYSEFLKSLNMRAEIASFSDLYLDRISQLINKTNQFNLTTQRYARAEVEAYAQSSDRITLYGRLTDKFGDNGLVTVIMAKIEEKSLLIDVWLMSCRVLKRQLEHAMFDALVQECKNRGLTSIVGYYLPTERNHLVSEHYPELGFQMFQGDVNSTHRYYRYEMSESYEKKNTVIEVSYGTY